MVEYFKISTLVAQQASLKKPRRVLLTRPLLLKQQKKRFLPLANQRAMCMTGGFE